MKSFKNWQLINESFFTLGIKSPNAVGGLMGKLDLSEAKKKKVEDKEEKEDKKDKEESEEKEEVCKCKDKMMKKKMKDKKKKFNDEEIEDRVDDKEDDVEDEEGDEGDDEEADGEEDVVDDKEGDEAEEKDGEEGEVEDKEAEKFGFMKDKKKKKKKKMRESFEDFAKSLSQYPTFPKDHSQDSEKEFFASLRSQYGNPGQRFNSGLSEDLLLPVANTEAPAPALEPQAGEVGFAPQGRLDMFTASEAAEYEVLKKYLNEDAAKKAIIDSRK